MNGGHCLDAQKLPAVNFDSHGYKCSCHHGYAGRNCEGKKIKLSILIWPSERIATILSHLSRVYLSLASFSFYFFYVKNSQVDT